MILYTAIPHELIFEDENEKSSQQKTVDMNGVKLLVEKKTDMEYEIIQLISSDPQHYLDGKYQPGQKMTLRPSLG